jgi:hypothetical protein
VSNVRFSYLRDYLNGKYRGHATRGEFVGNKTWFSRNLAPSSPPNLKAWNFNIPLTPLSGLLLTGTGVSLPLLRDLYEPFKTKLAAKLQPLSGESTNTFGRNCTRVGSC